ncbi:MAG: VWA domain-containing protein [Sphingomonas sp.]|uniref:vWA domain-containing protein n=1 Tax=Sphingomonas sp. TaxID=28214 RepID=UPI001AC34221|nr:VWA domain-containing protein [Sphingomonas sp.]MBN8816634.1 VWA domain-containing protein [Sphingomonas sp.]
MQSKPALLTGLSALLLTSAAAPVPLAAQRAVVPPPDTYSPVRCRVGQPEYNYAPPPVAPQPRRGGKTKADRSADSIVVTGSLSKRQERSRAGAVPSYAPPAPAAPPPPPVMAMPAPSGAYNNYAAPYGSKANTERYDGKAVASIQAVAAAPVSTFSVDVDTGSYANVRRFLNDGNVPPPDAVRTEEMINYFRYDYPRPSDRTQPFSVTTDVAKTPWNPNTRLLRIGLRGYDVATNDRPRANLVFLVDVSGSMNEPDKLPLVKSALTTLADRLRPNDKVSIVVYAGNAGIVLEPTADKRYVKAALDCLQAGGSTAGGAGIKLAYDTARANFVPGGINRIFLATDGDFNIGISDNKTLEEMVKAQRDDGITLTTLGFGQGNYNEAMMERIADVGNGNYAYIDSEREAEKVLDDELSATMVTIARDVKVQVEFNPAAVKEYRLIGYENRALAEEDFNNDAVDAGDMGAGHQVTALYEIVPANGAGWLPDRRYPANARPGRPAPVGGNELAFVKLRYKLPEGGASRLISRTVPASLMASAAYPSGDMAFVTAVAAFGQKLRGDKYLGAYRYADIARLAGSPNGYWRQEFVKLTSLAGSRGAAD